MKKRLKEMFKNTLVTRDGVVAEIRDFLFDIQSWKIIYISAYFQNMRKMALLPSNLIMHGWKINSQIYVDIINTEIDNYIKPMDKLSAYRQFEKELFRIYGYDTKNNLANDFSEHSLHINSNNIILESQNIENDFYLKSYQEIKDFNVMAPDGLIGKFYDFNLGNQLEILDMIVNHSYKIPLNKKAFIFINYIDNINMKEKVFNVKINKDHIKKESIL